jgi:hypothetical protein
MVLDSTLENQIKIALIRMYLAEQYPTEQSEVIIFRIGDKKITYIKVFNSVVLDDPRKQCTNDKNVNRGSRETDPSQVYFG